MTEQVSSQTSINKPLNFNFQIQFQHVQFAGQENDGPLHPRHVKRPGDNPIKLFQP
jgi:hypothetical protein